MLARQQHQVFAEEFAATNDAMRAYLKAYPAVNARTASANAARLLQRSDVAAEVERLRAPVREGIHQRAVITAAWVVEKLKAEVERKDTTPSARVSALKHLGDVLGMFERLPPLD